MEGCARGIWRHGATLTSVLVFFALQNDKTSSDKADACVVNLGQTKKRVAHAQASVSFSDLGFVFQCRLRRFSERKRAFTDQMHHASILPNAFQMGMVTRWFSFSLFNSFSENKRSSAQATAGAMSPFILLWQSTKKTVISYLFDHFALMIDREMLLQQPNCKNLKVLSKTSHLN